MCLFSVIIPHYNTVDYLKRMVRSIPVADDIQLIVADDKSQEDTCDIENSIISRGGIFIHNTTRQKGAGICRNLGIQEAKGKWLIFADADDFFLPDAFDKFRKYAESDADIIYFSPVSIYEDTGETAERHIYYESLIKKYLADPSGQAETTLRYKFVIPFSKMIRSEIVKNNHICYDETPAANDVMFAMKSAFCAKKIEATREVVYCVTKAENTLTTKHDENNFWARVEVFKRTYFFIIENLNVKEFGFWDLSGIAMIKRAVRQGYSFRFVLRIYKFLKKNKVPLISIRGAVNSIKRRRGKQ